MKKKSTQTAYQVRESVVFSDFSDKNRRSHSIKRLLTVLSVLVILALFGALIVHRFFRVKQIVVDGLSYYDYQTLVSASGVKDGQIIFSISEGDVLGRLQKALPHVRGAQVSMRLPASVFIEVEEETGDFFFEMQGEFMVITRQMKVLDRYLSRDALNADYPGLMEVSIPTVKSAITGQELTFHTDFESRHTGDALLALAEWDRYDRITKIDLSNRFSLKIGYMDRFEVDFGSYTDFADKLRLLEKMIDYYPEDATGSLSVRDVERGVAMIDGEEE